ncbi:MAG: iron ABC transporter permease [Planctomycetes bacterium]|nr:iron ABC transporter permease [Planctomycetota bacterium]MBU1518933.1 iron ABC transporter permease [Planctomycetota bacterium]MBU2457954.1 iron ABC transporter permease [Planctomycetota bacterium]
MKRKIAFILIIIFAILVVAVTPFIGSTKVLLSAIKDIDLATTAGQIFYSLRLPRVFTTFLAGAALACCGVALQAMFKNPLATPFTLGISGGAAFGAAVYVIFAASVSIFYGPIVFSFAGSLGAVILVYGLTRIKKGFSVGTMLLAGVAVNFFFSSLIMFLQYISDFTQSFRIIHWLMGSVDVTGFHTPRVLFVLTSVGIVIIAAQSLNLNLMSISDEIAAARGVNVKRTRKIIFLATSIMVAGVVAFCGPIGFVGLMAPHICRLLVGHDHKILTPAAILFGGAFLTLCDCVARTIIAPAEMPVGVITALLGGPLFVWLLLKGNSEANL